MNKKITIGLIAGITTGIAIYLISKMINEKKSSTGKMNRTGWQGQKERMLMSILYNAISYSVILFFDIFKLY